MGGTQEEDQDRWMMTDGSKGSRRLDDDRSGNIRHSDLPEEAENQQKIGVVLVFKDILLEVQTHTRR